MVELPPEVQYDEVSSRCRPEDHAAFLLVRPGARTSAALFLDLISATGADLLRFSIGKSLADARRIAIARLKARGIRTIVVGMAPSPNHGTPWPLPYSLLGSASRSLTSRFATQGAMELSPDWTFPRPLNHSWQSSRTSTDLPRPHLTTH